MQLGSFRITEGGIVGPRNFMREFGKQILTYLSLSPEVDRHRKEWGCSQELATLILLQQQYQDWYAAQRFADGFERAQELFLDCPPEERKIPVPSMN